MSQLELTEFQTEVARLILETPAPGKHCARSAIRHISKAWDLRNIDREMAAFRAITGEEESVSAIFHSLKRHGYKGANKLNHRNHVHKSAVFAFFRCVGEVLDITNQLKLEPKFELNKKEHPNRVRVRLTVFGADGRPLWAYPEPPLHYTVRLNDNIADFAEQLQKLASEKNCRDILSHIKAEANRRNRILYARAEGVPAVEDPIEDYLTRRRDIIFANLIVYLLIDPYREHQLFVRQALAAFLKMLQMLEDEEHVFKAILIDVQT
jgi:hypothetical protein